MKRIRQTLYIISLLSIAAILTIFFARNIVLNAYAEEINTNDDVITEVSWYYENGTKIEDAETLEKLSNLNEPSLVGQICCSPETMHKVTLYTEEHTYIPPLPAWFVYDKIRIVVCDYCMALWSRTTTEHSEHIHA